MGNSYDRDEKDEKKVITVKEYATGQTQVAGEAEIEEAIVENFQLRKSMLK